MSIQQEKFKAIADKIREKTGTTALIVPNDFADKIDEVYAAGKQAEYDRFWDIYQSNGNKTSYARAFSGWPLTIFKPKYNMKPTDAPYIFANTFPDNKGYSLIEALKDAGVTLDFSDCTNMAYLCYYSYLGDIGTIDATSASSLGYMFYYANYLRTIEKLILKEDGSQTFGSAFTAANKLKDIVIEGVIGANFDIHWSPLDKKSITSVFNALSSTTSGLTVTFSKTAVNSAFGIDVDDETTYPEGNEYYELRHSKDNWTVAYQVAYQ